MKEPKHDLYNWVHVTFFLMHFQFIAYESDEANLSQIIVTFPALCHSEVQDN
jgi:hypothetical protein